jgi:flagellin FlaB
MNWKKTLKKLLNQKRGIIGLEAAIILIAFVIIAAVFSFMVVNQGLFATQRGQTAIQEGLNEASTPLAVDGQMFVRTNTTNVGLSNATTNISAILIPLKAYGVASVPMWTNETTISLTVGIYAWANIYEGVNQSNPTYATFDHLLNGTGIVNATLFIQHSNKDEALDSFEKGFLIINLGWTTYAATVREPVDIEIRLEKSAPLSIHFNMPTNLPQNCWMGL